MSKLGLSLQSLKNTDYVFQNCAWIATRTTLYSFAKFIRQAENRPPSSSSVLNSLFERKSVSSAPSSIASQGFPTVMYLKINDREDIAPGTVQIPRIHRHFLWQDNDLLEFHGLTEATLKQEMSFVLEMQVTVTPAATPEAFAGPSLTNQNISEIFKTTTPVTISEKFAVQISGRSFSVLVTRLKISEASCKSDEASCKTGDCCSSPTSRGWCDKTTKLQIVWHDSLAAWAPDNYNSHSAHVAKLMSEDMDFTEYGIGGLNAELTNIFRRAFISRSYSAKQLEEMGTQHVRGILLYGLPGTGKTLLARKISDMLGVTEPKIVNGPEIFNKYVGQSEENMRNLFADAMNCKDPNKLHVVIFDEIDCIAGRRTDNDGTGAKASNNVVNQLLSLMDGVKGPKNVLVIGMTNRRDLIDSAMLRPGRFEVQIPFGLPDEKGRLAILEVHTKKMRAMQMLDKDVDLQGLAQSTVNFTGAEIAGLIRSAQSFAMMEQVRLKQASGTDVEAKKMTKLLVSQRHFDQAFDEVPPALGVAREKWENYQRGGILPFDDKANPKQLVEWCDLQIHSPSRSLLIYGPHGCGTTATAAHIAQHTTSYGCIRWLAPQKVLHLREAEKASILRDTFEQAFACEKSLIIIDDLEGWISYVSPARFSSVLFEQLMNLCRQTPPSGRSCTLVCTTHQYDFFMGSGWDGLFLKEHELPLVNTDNVHTLRAFYCEEDLSSLSLPAPIKTVVHQLGLPSSIEASH